MRGFKSCALQGALQGELLIYLKWFRIQVQDWGSRVWGLQVFSSLVDEDLHRPSMQLKRVAKGLGGFLSS